MDSIADYRFVEPLGQGNGGWFFVAVPPDRLRLAVDRVVVKVVTGPTTADTLRRATRELRVFAAVRSPYLARLYDAGQDGGRLYYAMENFPLGSIADRAGTMDRRAILRAVANASRAAHALHEAGIAHNGITASAVMIADDGARLADLGLAQVLSPRGTVTLLGPLAVLDSVDPAILRGAPGSRATDIWSLATVLHRALSGCGLWGELPADPLLAVRRMLGRPPEIAAGVPPEDRDLLASCLGPDPATRPPTALALAERLDALAAHHPVVASRRPVR